MFTHTTSSILEPNPDPCCYERFITNRHTVKTHLSYLQGVLEFETGETLKTIDIDIINDHTFKKDETFMVELTEVKTEGAKLGRLRRTVVTIVSDDGKTL